MKHIVDYLAEELKREARMAKLPGFDKYGVTILKQEEAKRTNVKAIAARAGR